MRNGKKKDGKRSYHTTLDDELLTQAKIQCLLERVELNKVIEGLLRQWLEEKKRNGPGLPL